MAKGLNDTRRFWTVRNRLILGYGIEILITVLLGGYALTRLVVIKDDAHRLSRDSLSGLSLIHRLDSQASKLFGLIHKHTVLSDPAASQRALSELESELNTIKTMAADYELGAVSAEDRAKAQPVNSALKRYLDACVAVATMDPRQVNEKLQRVISEVEPSYKAFLNVVTLTEQRQQSAGELAGNKIQSAVLNAEAGILAGICASILIVFFSGYFLVRAINQPLTRLTEAMERMREGDFTGRLEAGQRDEFGDLADGYNHMADSLSALVSQVQESGIVVNSSASNLASAVRQHESGAQQTASTTVEIGATAKEISVTSQELVKTVKEVAQVAEQTTTMAGNGQSGLLRMQETMVQVMGAASGISGKLTVLNEKAGSISQVVTTIAKVADQTNLLSLNAAIEAEKAGEYGRGFSVVATEIRRLADQTAVASHDIEQTVKEMQAAVSAGVMSVDKFSEEVRRGVQEVNQVGAQLNEIIGHVQALTPRFETVNEGMQMHAVGASQISSALVQLGESTQQTVHSLKQSNQTIERLNEATRMLRNAVSQFKLQTAVGVPERPRGIASLELRRNSDRPVDEGRKVDS
ncbi:MAG: methyl-accepting chemotaxis protein [Verrucomicrobiales bacterium]|nr:methyl-accepting chemotaxis protein [Verrucomicrobiales bacterium]